MSDNVPVLVLRGVNKSFGPIDAAKSALGQFGFGKAGSKIELLFQTRFILRLFILNVTVPSGIARNGQDKTQY